MSEDELFFKTTIYLEDIYIGRKLIRKGGILVYVGSVREVE